jgi:hypothetical protein
MREKQGTGGDDEADVVACLRGISGLLDAIEQRVHDVPEYRIWLERHGPDVLMELERHRARAS